MNQFSHDTFISPLTWRYGSKDMRALWSEEHKRLLLRHIWCSIAKVQMQAGIVKEEEYQDLLAHKEDIDIARASEIEAKIHHDLMAEIKTFAEQCSVGGGSIHMGATSMDILDNMDALRIRSSLELTLQKVRRLLELMAEKIEKYQDYPAMAFTHIQPAEPTTVGYRFAQYGQDLLMDFEELARVFTGVKGKGFKGAVGTAASYGELLHDTNMSPDEFDNKVMAELGIEAFDAATQTYPRKQDWFVLNALASVASSLYKFSFDLRILQTPPMGEWSEPFGTHQVGSSAMPFKRNPIRSEKVDSLARFVATLPRVAWDNAAHSLLERTLDDSANRRELFPAAFLMTDEVLDTLIKVVDGMQIHDVGVKKNLDAYGPFAATERVMMECAKAGGDRQELHEIIRTYSLTAWAAIQHGKPNPLVSLLQQDAEITKYLSAEEVANCMKASGYVGMAPVYAKKVLAAIRSTLGKADSVTGLARSAGATKSTGSAKSAGATKSSSPATPAGDAPC